MTRALRALKSESERRHRSAITELRRLLLRSPTEGRWTQRLEMLSAALDEEAYRASGGRFSACCTSSVSMPTTRER